MPLMMRAHFRGVQDGASQLQDTFDLDCLLLAIELD